MKLPATLGVLLTGIVLAFSTPTFSASRESTIQTLGPASSISAHRVSTTLPDLIAVQRKVDPSVVLILSTMPIPSDQAGSTLTPHQDLLPFPFRPKPEAGNGERKAPVGLGSGFIVDSTGYIVTNAHVVNGAVSVKVKLTNGYEYRATIVGADVLSDVAVIKIDGHDLPVVTIGNSDDLKVGEYVAAIGHPFGFEHSFSSGNVSGLGREIPCVPGECNPMVRFIQTQVPINPGNSGGPLIDMDGEVVGINSQIYSRTGMYGGISFSIPINFAMRVANQLRGGHSVRWGRIGVSVGPVSSDVAILEKPVRPVGVVVGEVEKGGPADLAGVIPGDIIVAFNGNEVTSVTNLQYFVSNTEPGKLATLDIVRKDLRFKRTVTVGEFKAPQKETKE